MSDAPAASVDRGWLMLSEEGHRFAVRVADVQQVEQHGESANIEVKWLSDSIAVDQPYAEVMVAILGWEESLDDRALLNAFYDVVGQNAVANGICKRARLDGVPDRILMMRLVVALHQQGAGYRKQAEEAETRRRPPMIVLPERCRECGAKL